MSALPSIVPKSLQTGLGNAGLGYDAQVVVVKMAMMHLLCHDVKIMPIVQLDLDNVHLESKDLQMLAKALHGKPLRELWLNSVDDDREINDGMYALLEVMKASTATDREFCIRTRHSVEGLRASMPEGTPHERYGVTFRALTTWEFHIPNPTPMSVEPRG